MSILRNTVVKKNKMSSGELEKIINEQRSYLDGKESIENISLTAGKIGEIKLNSLTDFIGSKNFVLTVKGE